MLDFFLALFVIFIIFVAAMRLVMWTVGDNISPFYQKILWAIFGTILFLVTFSWILGGSPPEDLSHLKIEVEKVDKVETKRFNAPILNKKNWHYPSTKNTTITISVDITEYMERNKLSQEEAQKKIKENLIESNIIANYGDPKTTKVSIK